MPSVHGRVLAVCSSPRHDFGKQPQASIRLIPGVGVEGDAHAGPTVQHRSRVAADPTQPNLRQVHLIHRELQEELAAGGFEVPPGALGENVTTEGIDLLALPVGATLLFGGEALVAITGLRNPCVQIDRYQAGLLKRVAYRDEEGRLVRRAGVMGVVLAGGVVAAGMRIAVSLPPSPHHALDRV